MDAKRRNGKQPEKGGKAKKGKVTPNIAPLLEAENSSLSSSGAPLWNPHINTVKLGLY